MVPDLFVTTSLGVTTPVVVRPIPAGAPVKVKVQSEVGHE
jgi:hypothetical protein